MLCTLLLNTSKADSTDLKNKIYTDYTTVETSASSGSSSAVCEIGIAIKNLLSDYQPVNCIANASYDNTRFVVMGCKFSENRCRLIIMPTTTSTAFAVNFTDSTTASVVSLI